MVEAAQQNVSFELHVNGSVFRVDAPPCKTLADVLREECGLTGTHLGCEHGSCGACTVLVDGAPVRSCLMFAIQAQGAAIETVEGLADGETLHPLQTAFIEHDALQCGFCTPGFLMLAKSLFDRQEPMARDDIVTVLSSNLCRCTGYRNIITAVASCIEARADAAGNGHRKDGSNA